MIPIQLIKIKILLGLGRKWRLMRNKTIPKVWAAVMSDKSTFTSIKLTIDLDSKQMRLIARDVARKNRFSVLVTNK
jgi:hypothetical protein